jgi:hypothetical protein
MKTKTTFEVGDRVRARTHCYNNVHGGTEFGGVIVATVTKTWHDYEIGQRYIGKTSAGKTVYFGDGDGLSPV